MTIIPKGFLVPRKNFRTLTELQRYQEIKRLFDLEGRWLPLIKDFKIVGITNEEIVLDTYFIDKRQVRLAKTLITDVTLSELKVGQCFKGIAYIDLYTGDPTIGPVQFIEFTKNIKPMSKEELERFHQCFGKME